MPCDHFQPSDLCQLAEKFCLENQLPSEQREHYEFYYGQNEESWGHRSVLMGTKWSNEKWVVFKLDRLPNPLPSDKLGFLALKK